MTVSAFLRQGQSPYNTLTGSQARPVSINKNNNELLFVSTVSESSACIVFRVDDQNKYYFDNLSFYEADASITNIDDSVRFEYNASKNPKTISLNGTYIDVKNKIIFKFNIFTTIHISYTY